MKELLREYVRQCLLFQTDEWLFRLIGVVSWLCLATIACVSYWLVSHIIG